MTTVTLHTPRLPEHCPHYLPTSCALTSTPQCCACRDKRPHSESYSKYIDGVGFVLRGTRQERYCWTCKEFWNARIAATHPPLRQSQTRLPDIPDVTIFLEQWYDWYQGYRIIQRSDGTQEQQVLEGERLHDVPPGLLPRTQEELESDEHSGSSSHLRAVESVFNTYLSTPRELETLDLPGENLNTLPNEREDTLDPEDTIFDLTSTPFRRQSSNTLIESFNTFLPEREQPISFIDPEHRTLNLPSTQAHLQEDHSSEPQPEGQIFHPSTGTSTRRIESLRSELQHLRTAIERIMSGLQELGGQIPDSQNAENAERNLDDIHYRLQDFEIPLRLTAAYRSEMVRFNGNNGHRPSMMAGDVLERPRRVRTGTTINNGAVRHHSPDAAMFDTTRRTDAGNRTDVRAQMANARRYLENERRLLDQSAVGRREHMGELMRAINGPSYADEWHHDTGVPPFSAGLPNSPWLGTMPIPVEAEAAGQRGLDRDDGRPAPKEAAEMMCNMECKICFTQVASIALLPCGHLAMCEWCAEMSVPSHRADRTQPAHSSARAPIKCPVCRSKVKQRVKIYTVG